LTLTAKNWTNSSVIQAGRLTVNVDNLTQTGTGQLLASTSLEGNGENWSNDGLIASDGSISLVLGGSYGGSGRMSSLGGIDLTAAQLNLGVTSSIAGGGDTTVKIGGQLTNAGRLTSSANLTVQAGNLVNSGTLGSARNLVLKTPSLLNDRGLVFSGADMTLGVSNFTNQSGDLYGLGNVVIGGYGAAARAASVNNVSGSMESGGTFTINADGFQNRTEGAVASGGRKLISGFIANICNDCKGDYYTFTLAAREVFESVDNDTSASSLLTAGKDFVFQGSSFLNSKSTVSAGGNINIVADNVQNIGAQNGTIERTRMYQVAGMSDGGTGRFFANVLTPYNQRNNPDFPYVYYLDLDGNIHKAIPKSTRYREGGRDGETLSVVTLTDVDTGAAVKTRGDYNLVLSGLSYGFENTTQSQYDPNNLLQMPNLDQYNLLSDIEIAKDSSGAASTVGSRNAVIQAGGKVSITATKDLQNSVIHEDYTASGGTNKVADTQASGTGTTVVRINNQLPPDRAQQQVNPLSLPGFALPSGQNGLFRLSGQGGSAQQATQASTGSQNWSMGSASISTRQRQQDLPDAQARDVQVGAIAAVGTSDRQLALITRQANDSNVSASTLNVSAPVEGSHSLPMPSRNSGVGIGTQVAAVNVTGTNLLPTAQVVPQVGNAVDTPAAGQAVVRVQGVPETSFKSNPQKYLIETNPVLTDLKSFMSSDYLLQNLGYDPDQSAKRLGDGLYEQRLIQQAVVARTGQRFIDGQTSDEGLFKYLMNNAIASKQELGLSVGVTLTSEQVAALTHDIVWLEEHEVNGEKVLVPVLYLAQAEGRLGPTGALIAGNDVTLIAGQNLDNVGTLRAANNLSATAGSDLVNSGLIQAGNRLDLLAVNNIANQAGGILAGRDVNIKAVMGDVVNERTVTTANYSRRQDFMDSAARIEAANDLDMGAGRDIKSVGSVMVSGRDTTIDAGRDAIIVSAQQESASNNGVRKSAVTQFGSSVQAGRDMAVNAGRDLNVIASQLGAERNVALTAGENMTISSAADETHSYSKTKKVTIQEDHVKQIGSAITAGGDVTMGAGKDMAIISSRISAGDEAYLVAGGNLDVLAAQDSDYSLYDKKKKGSWGKKKTKHDEVTKVTNVGSEITAGGDLTLVSGDDQRYQAAKLNSGGDLTVQSGGAITIEGVKDLVQETHTKSNGDAFWTSSKGKGNTDETLRQTQMVAAGSIMIKAVDGLHIDVTQVNKETVSQSIDAMVKADPKLAWLKEAEARGDVDWRQVKEIHESFKYSNSGLGPASQLIIAIMMSVVMGPAGLGVVSAGAGGAFATSLATTAVTSTINNKGNLGAAFKETFSADSLKGAAIAGVTAGVLNYADENWFAAASQGSKSANLLTSNNFTDVAIRTGGRAVLSSGISTAIGGGSFGDNLSAALMGEAGSVAMATGFNWVGDNIKFPDGGFQKIVAHAIMGGLLAEAMGSDFKTGAVAAGLNEALIPGMTKIANGNQELQVMLSQLTGLLAAAAVGGDLDTASKITQNATTFNYLFHAELVEKEQRLNACTSPSECQSIRDYYNNLDAARNKEFGQFCRQNPTDCGKITQQLVAEIPENEKLLEAVRVSGSKTSFADSIQLWLSTQNNQQAINTSIVEKSRSENGQVVGLLTDVALGALYPDLFASTAGGKGGTTGIKNGVVEDGANSGIKNIYESIRKAPQYPEGFKERIGGTTKNVVNNMDVLDDLRKVEPGKWAKVYKDGFASDGSKVSVHYFQSESGKVFNVKTKPGWSNN
jgi:filamentous hemagglutinin